MSPLPEETPPEQAAASQETSQEDAFNEGFALEEDEDGAPGGRLPAPQEEPRAEQSEGTAPAAAEPPGPMPILPAEPEPSVAPAPQPEPEQPPVGRVEVPEEIADEFEALKKLNPDAAALALEDTPEGASVRARLEQYGAELAQDRAEQVLYRRAQAQAQREAETARLERAREAHNAAFQAMFERDHPAYAAMLADPGRKAEAAQYQQAVFAWIAAKPYAEAAKLMRIAKQGRDPAQVSALLSRFERERGGKPKQPDPTGALAVPGRGAPVAPSGVGDKDDFDAGWNTNV